MQSMNIQYVYCKDLHDRIVTITVNYAVTQLN